MSKSVVWAHQGASAYFPENTLPSFQGAADMKADGVELDVHMTYDGKIIVSHDRSLKRCGGGDVVIEAVSYAEIKRHPVPGRFSDKYPDVVCPLLSEVYELLRPYGMLIKVEIIAGWKFDYIKELVKLTHDMHMQDYVLYSSFDHTTLHGVRTIDKTCRIGALYGGLYCGDIPEVTAYAKALGFTEIHPYFPICRKENYVKNAVEAGLNVNPWTMLSEKTIREMVNLGCHGIITDFPDIARKVIDEAK